jgi:hypothetical protein
MSQTKGQGLSISTIVIAAIALLVLVILAVLVLRAGQNTGEGVTNCPGECGETCEARNNAGGLWTKSITGKCGENNGECCIPLNKPTNNPSNPPTVGE